MSLQTRYITEINKNNYHITSFYDVVSNTSTQRCRILQSLIVDGHMSIVIHIYHPYHQQPPII